MKPNVKLLIAVALLATACTTGSKVTSGGYSDDFISLRAMHRYQPQTGQAGKATEKKHCGDGG